MIRKFVFFLFACSTALSLNAQGGCSHRPVVFVHGFLASGDTYAGQIQRLIKRGYCEDRLFVFDWNSVSGNGKKTDSLLKVFIDDVLAKTGAKQIDLVGHSAGGGLGRGYLMDSVNAAKVAHYVHLGSRKWFYEYSWFPNNRCLNIYSADDNVMGSMGGAIDGAVNLDLKTKDHYEVATSEETLEAIYAFFTNDKIAPVMRTNLTGPVPVFISGKAMLLGENTAMKDSWVNVFQLSGLNGTRQSNQPQDSFRVNAAGSWGPFWADPKLLYEIELKPADTTQPLISYFFEPFTQTNPYVYLRGFPKGNMIGMMLKGLPQKDDQSMTVVYSSNKAMIAGRDSVTVNGVPISSPALTPAAKTIISSFIFDDGDNKTSGKGLKQFAITPFIGGVDICLPVKKETINTVYYNGRKIMLPARPSKERIMLAVFN